MSGQFRCARTLEYHIISKEAILMDMQINQEKSAFRHDIDNFTILTIRILFVYLFVYLIYEFQFEDEYQQIIDDLEVNRS
jgi:hypothetical protein